MNDLKGEFLAAVMAFEDGNDDPFVDETVVVEVTDWSDSPEIAWSVVDTRYYLKFRQSDFNRALRELRG